ncbi:hypothetical protein N9948_00810 [bacterium]|nr:hypothetical protein [bacterium]
MGLLVKYEANWADEMDIRGLVFVTEEHLKDWDRLKEISKTIFNKYGETDLYFGTNEFNPCGTHDCWFSDLKETPITEENLITMKNVIADGKHSYGIFPVPHYYSVDNIEDEDTIAGSEEQEFYDLCNKFNIGEI